MQRRQFIHAGLLVSAYSFLQSFTHKNDPAFIITVTGKIPAEDMGFSLAHEHVLVDFIGADKIIPGRYDEQEAFEKALPSLNEVSKYGGRTFVECTPNYLGRDVKLLQRLSNATGIQVITNTGYYGAAKEKFIPGHARTQTAQEVAAIWIKEYKEGIDGSGIKPGFIKTGVDDYPLSAVQQKLVEAAAITHLATGLTIAIHTGNGEAAMEELRILKAKKVAPAAWIWVHAQNEKDRSYHYKIAQEGGWISFDGLSKESLTAYIQFLSDMKQRGLSDKVLISHDAGWYHVGEPGGGEFRSYNSIFNDLLPAMRNAAFSEQDIEQVFVSNPMQAFTIRVRELL